MSNEEKLKKLLKEGILAYNKYKQKVNWPGYWREAEELIRSIEAE